MADTNPKALDAAPERVWIDIRNDDLWMDRPAALIGVPEGSLVEYVRALPQPDRGEMVERMGALLEQWSYPRSTWERLGITAEAAALALLDAARGPATDQEREG